jgi:hypothetical protein
MWVGCRDAVLLNSTNKGYHKYKRRKNPVDMQN